MQTREYFRNYYLKNKEKLHEYKKAWYNRNRERILEKNRLERVASLELRARVQAMRQETYS